MKKYIILIILFILCFITIAYLKQQFFNNKIVNISSVNEIHNEMNDARKKAIDDSIKVLLDLAKKYGRDNVRQNLAKGQKINWENEADKKKYDDALEVLNLTSANIPASTTVITKEVVGTNMNKLTSLSISNNVSSISKDALRARVPAALLPFTA